MDPVSHGLLGASAAASFAKKKQIAVAVVAGWLAAMAPDLDVLIRSSADPLLTVEMHRQFTHSLIFMPFGAFIVTILLWMFIKRYLTFQELYLFTFLGIATHGLMDAFTSYGTQLFWPFTDARIAWNMVSVIDPVVTLGMVLFASLAIWRKKRFWAWISLGWFALCMMFGYYQGQRASAAAIELAETRGHQPERLVARPSFGNQILWRVNYIYDGHIYTDAVRPGFFSETKIYEGGSLPEFVIETEMAGFESTTLYSDLERFRHFSDGYLTRHPENPNIIGDTRYSMIPTSMIPLWGVEIDTTDTARHLPFSYYRDIEQEDLDLFFDMLFGR